MPDTGDVQDNEALVQQAMAGDETAFAALFDRWYARIHAFSYRIVLDGHAADDAAQETFIRAAKSIRQLKNTATFESWLFRIAANQCRDELRRRGSQQRRVDLAREEMPGADNHHADAPVSDRVDAALRALPAKQREAVALVYFEECSHQDAAARLGCAESTVSWRIHLAKRSLKKLLNDG